MKKICLLTVVFICVLNLCSCDSKNTIKPIKTVTDEFSLPVAAEMVESGEKIIVGICGKETVSQKTSI